MVSYRNLPNLVQLPAKAVPKTPTANSAQTRRNKITMATIAIILLLKDFAFRATKSIAKPRANNNPPATKKSNKDQFTSDENCMAVNGIESNTKTNDRIIRYLLLIDIEMDFNLH